MGSSKIVSVYAGYFMGDTPGTEDRIAGFSGSRLSAPMFQSKDYLIWGTTGIRL